MININGFAKSNKIALQFRIRQMFLHFLTFTHEMAWRSLINRMTACGTYSWGKVKSLWNCSVIPNPLSCKIIPW